MMMGFGSYGNGGGSSPPSSHLSALAPPFTVDRSLSKPLVDLTEPPLNWLNTHPLSFDSMHSSNAYGYSFNIPSAAHIPPPENTIPVASTDALFYGQNSDAMLTSNLVEAKPFYPSYVSPTKYTYDDYAQSLSGLWDGSRGWEFSKQVELNENFCLKEMNVPDLSIYQDYSEQGAHLSKGLNTSEQSTNSINTHGGQKHVGSTNGEQLDYKSFPGQVFEILPAEYSGKSFLGSTSLFSETCSLLSGEQGWSKNHQTPYSPLLEKGAKQHSVSRKDISSVEKSSSGLIIRSQAVGSGPSVPNTTSFNRMENGSKANNMNFFGSDNFSKMKDLHPVQSSDGKVVFDASQANFHLDGGIPCFQELPLENKNKHISNVNVISEPFREKSEIQIPDLGTGCFSSVLVSNGILDCLEGSSESLDQYNPAVDSPCWKGASVYHFSPLENSEPVTLPLKKKLEACFNSIGPTDSSVKFSYQKPVDYSLYHENGCLANNSESSPKDPSLANLLFKEHGNNCYLKTESYDMKSGCGLGVQFSDYIDKQRQDFTLAKSSVEEFNFKSFPMQEHSVENEQTFDKKFESETGVTDIGMSTKDASEGCSYHVPLNATKHVLSSPSSVETAPSKLTKSLDVEFAPKMRVQTIVSAMHNLSELLLFHCSNEVFELKENDLDALHQVVNNLDKCISKTMVPGAPLQESMLKQKSTQPIRELPELQEGLTVSRPQDTKAAFPVLNQPNYQHMQEDRVHHIMSGKKDGRGSVFTSQGGDSERVKEDNMTQAIKKVLSENFSDEEDEKLQTLLYKNLWLEAEAALCSINYKARFDRMKIELEKSKLLKTKENTTTELEKLSESTFSPDQNTVEKLPPEVKDDFEQDVSVQGFPAVYTSSHPDDVIARYHILEAKESNANRRTIKDVEKVSSDNTSPDIDKVDKMASETENDQKPDISTLGLPNSSSTSCADDVESLVMARFHILRSRVENSCCAENMGDEQPSQDGTLDGNTEPVFQPISDNDSQEIPTVKEFHLDIKDDPVIQTPWMNNRLGNQLPASFSDSSSSDWEHVSKEDLSVQNA